MNYREGGQPFQEIGTQMAGYNDELRFAMVIYIIFPLQRCPNSKLNREQSQTFLV